MTDEERMLWTENGRLQGRVSELEAEVSKLLNTLADERTENMRLRAALEDVVASGLLHGPTILSDKVLNIVHAALAGEEGK